MDYKKIEELFTDYIFDIIGPNKESETEREYNLDIINSIINNALREPLADFITHMVHSPLKCISKMLILISQYVSNQRRKEKFYLLFLTIYKIE